VAHPTPEECSHPAPVIGIMAHEFSPYRGARGPEGTRRTTMYYGPVVGGLPIDAWHCEVCGLLRLTYPDGRKEERRLWPGPQPGLIAAADVVALEQVTGRQARVSGLTATPELFSVLAPTTEPYELALPQLPDWGFVTWATVLLLCGVMGGLIAGAFLAVYTWYTPAALRPLFFSVLGCFGGAVAVQVLGAAFRHAFPMPRLGASPAVALRGKPAMDGVTRVVVAILVITIGVLISGAVLAVYTWYTPGILRPVFFAGLGLFGAAVALKLLDAARRYLTGR
jgi:hypothetical protein